MRKSESCKMSGRLNRLVIAMGNKPCRRSVLRTASVGLGCLAGFLSLLLPFTLLAQSVPSPPSGHSGIFPERQWLRDPFSPSKLMYDSVASRSGIAANIYGFVPTAGGGEIPKMKLRGLLNPKDGEFVALLEIIGVGTYMVREGDEFNIDPSHPKSAIRISKITRLSVTVETGMLGSIRVMR